MFAWWDRGCGQHLHTGVCLTLFNILIRSAKQAYTFLLPQCIAICRKVLKERLHSLYNAISKYSLFRAQKACLEFLGLQNILDSSLTKLLVEDFNFSNASLKHMLSNHGNTHLDAIRFMISFLCTDSTEQKMKFMSIKNVLKTITHKMYSDNAGIKVELVTILTQHVLQDEKISKRIKSIFLSVPSLVKISHFLEDSSVQVSQVTECFLKDVFDFKLGILYQCSEENIFGSTSSNPTLINFVKYRGLNSPTILTIVKQLVPVCPEIFPVVVNTLLTKQNEDVRATLQNISEFITTLDVAIVIQNTSSGVSDERLIEFFLPSSVTKLLEKELKSTNNNTALHSVLCALLKNISEVLKRLPARKDLGAIASYKLPDFNLLCNQVTLSTELLILYLHIDPYCLYQSQGMDVIKNLQIKGDLMSADEIKLLYLLPRNYADDLYKKWRPKLLSTCTAGYTSEILSLIDKTIFSNDTFCYKAKILSLYCSDLGMFLIDGVPLEKHLKSERSTFISTLFDSRYSTTSDLLLLLQHRCPKYYAVITAKSKYLMKFKVNPVSQDVTFIRTTRKTLPDIQIKNLTSECRNNELPSFLIGLSCALDEEMCENMGIDLFCRVASMIVKDDTYVTKELKPFLVDEILSILSRNFNSSCNSLESFVSEISKYFEECGLNFSWYSLVINDSCEKMSENYRSTRTASIRNIRMLLETLENDQFNDLFLRRWEKVAGKYFLDDQQLLKLFLVQYRDYDELLSAIPQTVLAPLATELDMKDVDQILLKIAILKQLENGSVNVKIPITKFSIDEVKQLDAGSQMDVLWPYVEVTTKDSAEFILSCLNFDQLVKVILDKSGLIDMSGWLDSKKQLKRLLKVFDEAATENDLKSFLAISTVTFENKLQMFILKFMSKKVQKLIDAIEEHALCLSLITKIKVYFTAFQNLIPKETYCDVYLALLKSSDVAAVLKSPYDPVKPAVLSLILVLLKSKCILQKNLQKVHLDLFQEAYLISNSSSDKAAHEILLIFENLGIYNRYPFGYGQYVNEILHIKNLTLYSEVCIRIIESLDKTKLLNLVNNFRLNTEVESEDEPCEMYNLEYLLSLSYYVLDHNQVGVSLFLSNPIIQVILLSLSSHEYVVRRVGYSCVEKLTYVTAEESFKEKAMCLYILEMLKNSISEINQRLPHLFSYFLGIMMVVMFSPQSNLYLPICHFLLQRPTFDFTDVPMFYTLFCSSTLNYKSEQNWILKVLINAVKDESDYRILGRRHVLPICISQLNINSVDKYTAKLIRKLFNVCLRIKSNYVQKDLENIGIFI